MKMTGKSSTTINNAFQQNTNTSSAIGSMNISRLYNAFVSKLITLYYFYILFKNLFF